MINDKEEVNHKISYDIKLSQLGWIYYIADQHMTDHIIIRFMILQLPFFLNTSSNKHISI